MDIANQSHWETINTKRMHRGQTSRNGLRAWLGNPPARKILYQIIDKFFISDNTKSVIEVGCAPGERLLEFASRYQYIPYGVEYTEAGVKGAREKFKACGIPEDHCIYSDVFDHSFQSKYKDTFDSVISFGVIEHFTNVNEIINAHLNILKPGGKLLVMIPRLQGIYYPLTKLLYPDLLLKHNLNIMQISTFRRLFSKNSATSLFCGYYGVLNFGMLQGNGKVQNLIVRSLQIAQVFFNPILRHCHIFENRATSPYLLFVGTKLKNQEFYL